MPRTVKKDKHLVPGRPEKPSNLSARASAEWDRLSAELDAAGIQITPAHRSLIALAATLAADIKADYAELGREGWYTNSPKGSIQAYPAVI